MVAGFQPVMPSFQGKISGPEVAALVEYIKSLQSDAVRDRARRKDPPMRLSEADSHALAGAPPGAATI